MTLFLIVVTVYCNPMLWS